MGFTENLTVETCYKYLKYDQKIKMLDKLKKEFNTAYIFCVKCKKDKDIVIGGKYIYKTKDELAHKIIDDMNLYLEFDFFCKCAPLFQIWSRYKKFETIRNILNKVKNTRYRSFNVDISPSHVHKIYKILGYEKLIDHLETINDKPIFKININGNVTKTKFYRFVLDENDLMNKFKFVDYKDIDQSSTSE